MDKFDFNIEIPDIEIDFDMPMMDKGFKNRYEKSKIAKDLPAQRSGEALPQAEEIQGFGIRQWIHRFDI